MVDFSESPGDTMTSDGAAERVKSGELTISTKEEVWLSEPEVPVIVTVTAPGVALLLAVRVRVLIPVVGFGEKVAVTPLGRPETARFTLPVKPY